MQQLRAWSLNAYLNLIIDFYITRRMTPGKLLFLTPQDRCFACHLRIIIAYLRKLSCGLYELTLISNSILCNHSCYEHMCTDVDIQMSKPLITLITQLYSTLSRFCVASFENSLNMYSIISMGKWTMNPECSAYEKISQPYPICFENCFIILVLILLILANIFP